MSEYILVRVAWPYANSQIHVGNLTGSYLPADIFARYHRLGGNQVAMVSGSDAHGTPVTVRADAEGTTPLKVYQSYHASFLELFQKLGLTYDLFTSTHTENHFKVSQDIFLALHAQQLPVHRAAKAVVRRLRRDASCLTAMWKAPATSAATPMPAATSVMAAAACWMPLS